MSKARSKKKLDVENPRTKNARIFNFYLTLFFMVRWGTQEQENFLKRRALVTTETELKAIAAPAMMGLRSQPKRVSRRGSQNYQGVHRPGTIF